MRTRTRFADSLVSVKALLVLLLMASGYMFAGNASLIAQDKPKAAQKTNPRVDVTGGPPAKAPAPLTKTQAELADVIYLLPDDSIADRLARNAANPSHFQHELIRQAFWLSAREEFGLRVRDADLGESVPEGLPEDRQFRFRERLQGNSPWILTLGRKREHQLWGGSYIQSSGDGALILGLRVPAAEGLSRGFYIECLEAAGFQRRANKLSDAAKPSSSIRCPVSGFQRRANKLSDAAVPARVEELLGKMRETDQFAAVRLLHAEVRAKGESDALLLALARGYANLGLLTEYHFSWSPMVFKARGLLYAQRVLSRSPKSALAMWTRAYAATLAGAHARGLGDLEAAAKLASGPPAVKPPQWVEVIDAYLHFDESRLATARKESDTPLVRLLQFLAAEEPSTPAATIRAGQNFLKTDPECYRVHDSMCRTGGVSHLHGATAEGMILFAQHIPDRVREQPESPKVVPESIEDPKDEFKLYEALIKAGDARSDRGEPSWAAFGNLVRDVRLTQCLHRLDFLAHSLGVSTAETAGAAATVLQGHPLLPLINSFEGNPVGDGVAIRQFLIATPTDNLDLRAAAYRNRMRTIDSQAHIAFLNLNTTKKEALYYEDVSYARILTAPSAAAQRLGEWLQEISPHSPAAQAFAVGEPGPIANLPKIEKANEKHAVVQRAIGEVYFKNKQYKDAARCWEAWIRLSPDIDGYRKLAQAYRADGNEERWLETLEASLKIEDAGLGHAQVQTDLAWHFMRKKDYKRAEPYAEGAAESGAEWAYQCLAECYMGLQNWDKANEIFSDSAERYTGSAFDWYLACRASGKMEPDAAEKAVQRILGRLGPLPQRIAFQAGQYYLIKNKLKEALAAFSREDFLHSTDVTALYVAMTADALGSTKLRDETLGKMEKLAPTQTGKELGAIMSRWIAQPKLPDDETIDADLKKLPASTRPAAYFFTGWFLQNRKEDERARRYLINARDSVYLNSSIQKNAVIFLDQKKK